MLMRNADIARLLNPKPVSWSRFEEIKKRLRTVLPGKIAA